MSKDVIENDNITFMVTTTFLIFIMTLGFAFYERIIPKTYPSMMMYTL